MSITIVGKDVVSVLLSDGWHAVRNESFTFEFLHIVNATTLGFSFEGMSGVEVGPVSSIQAMRLKDPKEKS